MYISPFVVYYICRFSCASPGPTTFHTVRHIPLVRATECLPFCHSRSRTISPSINQFLRLEHWMSLVVTQTASYHFPRGPIYSMFLTFSCIAIAYLSLVRTQFDTQTRPFRSTDGVFVIFVAFALISTYLFLGGPGKIGSDGCSCFFLDTSLSAIALLSYNNL